MKSSPGILPGVDVRADGAYVVAAPSTHASGIQYAWANSELALAEVPAWLAPTLVSRKENRLDQSIGNTASIGSHPPIPDGIRNNTLFLLGSSLRGQLAMGEEEIAERLLLFNQVKCRPPLDEAEVAGIVESVCKYPAESGGKKSGTRLERNPLYWFKVNVRDFNGNQAIQRMTDRQLGWYYRLYVSAWQSGGTLPDDETTLWRIAGASSRKVFERESALVLEEYESVNIRGKKRLIHRRMAAEYADVLEQWLKVKAAGEANRVRLSALRTIETTTHSSNPPPLQ